MYASAKDYALCHITVVYMHIHLFQGSGELLRLEVGEVLLNGTNATFHPFSNSFQFPGKKCGFVCNVKDGVSMDGHKHYCIMLM